MKFYVDTSVFGGIFDDEFKEDTAAFLTYARDSDARLIYSNITEEELITASQRVRELPKKIVEYERISLELIIMDQEAEALAETYIREGALTEKCRNDARHIALATLYGVTTLVSWNFKHMVNLHRIQQYNSINIRLGGYNDVNIRSPKEVLP